MAQVTYMHDSNGNIFLTREGGETELRLGDGMGVNPGRAFVEQVLGDLTPQHSTNGAPRGVPALHSDPLTFSGAFGCSEEQWRLFELASRFIAGEQLGEIERGEVESVLCAYGAHAMDSTQDERISSSAHSRGWYVRQHCMRCGAHSDNSEVKWISGLTTYVR